MAVVNATPLASPVEISDSTNAPGTSSSFVRADHVHAHGVRGGGSLHAVATAVTAGFMSAADKAALDAHLVDVSNPHVVTVQQAYTATAGVPHVTLAAAQPFTIRDNAAPIGNVFVLEETGGANFFDVAPTTMSFGDAAQRLFTATNIIGGYGGFEIYPDDFTRTIAGTAVFSWTSTLTTAMAGGGGIGNDTAPNFVSWAGEVLMTDQGNLFNSQSLFTQGTTITCQGANSGPIYTLINQPKLRTGSTGGARVVSQQNAVRSQISVGPNIAGSITVTSHEAFFATAIIDATVGSASITTVNYFAPKAPTLTAGGTVGTLNVMDIPNIPAAGITTLRGINSAMSSGTFINHEGTAPVQLGGSIFLGAGSTFDWELSRLVANIATLSDGDSFRITDGSMFFGTSGGSTIRSVTDGELAITADLIGFNVVPAGSDTYMTIAAPARTASAGGTDIANCLNSSGGTLTLDALYVSAAQWIVNAPTLAGTTPPTNASNMVIQTNVNAGVNRFGLRIISNPTGGGGINAALYVATGLARFDGRVDINNLIALGGGAAATLGTIGGSGPTAAGQAIWVEVDVGGVAHWLPAWV